MTNANEDARRKLEQRIDAVQRQLRRAEVAGKDVFAIKLRLRGLQEAHALFRDDAHKGTQPKHH